MRLFKGQLIVTVVLLLAAYPLFAQVTGRVVDNVGVLKKMSAYEIMAYIKRSFGEFSKEGNKGGKD